jgi:hypothetical protein
MNRFIKKGTSEIPVTIVAKKEDFLQLSSGLHVKEMDFFNDYEVFEQPNNVQMPGTKPIVNTFGNINPQPVFQNTLDQTDTSDPVRFMEYISNMNTTIPVITDANAINEALASKSTVINTTAFEEPPKGAYVDPNVISTIEVQAQDGTKTMPRHLQKKKSPELDLSQFDEEKKYIDYNNSNNSFNSNSNNSNNSNSMLSKMKMSHPIKINFVLEKLMPDPTALKYMVTIFDEPLIESIADQILMELLKDPQYMRKIIIDKLEQTVYGNTKRVGKNANTKSTSKNKNMDVKPAPSKKGSRAKKTGDA